MRKINPFFNKQNLLEDGFCLNYGKMRCMKKAIVIIVIIIGVAALFYTISGQSPIDKTVAPTTNKGDTFRPDPSNATFTIDDEQITLSGGRKNAPSGETGILDKFAYGDISADGKDDTVLFLVQSGGGSGTFIYLAGYVSGPVTYRGSAATFIGDRIAPESISINKGVVTVKYLDRKEDEAFAAEPTIPVSRQFVFKNGEFVEK